MRKRLDAAAEKLRKYGYEVFAARTDVTRASAVATLVEKTEKTLVPIEILVNNAGIGYFGPIQNASEEIWDSVLDTNLKIGVPGDESRGSRDDPTEKRARDQYRLAGRQEHV